GVTITTTGSATFDSESTSNLDIEAKQSLLGPTNANSAVNVTLAIGKSDIQSKTILASGSTVTASGPVNVQGGMNKKHNVYTNAAAYSEGSVGIGISVTVGTNTVQAEVDGKIAAGGNVQITSLADTLQNRTASNAGVGNGFLANTVIGLKDGTAF